MDVSEEDRAAATELLGYDPIEREATLRAEQVQARMEFKRMVERIRSQLVSREIVTKGLLLHPDQVRLVEGLTHED